MFMLQCVMNRHSWGAVITAMVALARRDGAQQVVLALSLTESSVPVGRFREAGQGRKNGKAVSVSSDIGT
jgi:hypothetical protein